MSRRLLDEVDERILEHLARDARLSNREIADALGLAEGTVRGRIKRLQADKMIKIMAIADVRAMTPMENPMMAYIGIRADLDRRQEIAHQIADLPFVRFAATMLGRYDILAISFVRSGEELLQHVNDDILAIEGVRHADTSLAVKNLKYDYRWGRIVG